ncbi:MAG: hypothetical protein GY867_10680 [bacterium]|nr:hypothetical protein [bacterium]
MRLLTLISALLVLALPVAAETVHLLVAASSDDAHAYGSTGLLTSFSYPRFGQNSMMEGYESAVRFVNVAIDSGATVDSAFLEFRARTALSGDSIVYVVAAEDTTRAASFSDRANYDLRLGNLTETSSSRVLHSTTTDTWYRSPDISALIEGLLARSGWQKDSSDIALFLRPTEDSPADVWFEIYHWDGNSSSAHKLHVYLSDGTNQPKPGRRRNILSHIKLNGGQ